MRSRAETGLALFLALGVFLGGCSSVPQTKTILLPEREARETGAEETEGQSYAVRKIYSREIEDGLSWAPEIYLDGEHSFRWWTERPAENSMESGKMVLAEISMDYRYGFYEERLLPLEAENRFSMSSMPRLLRDVRVPRRRHVPLPDIRRLRRAVQGPALSRPFAPHRAERFAVRVE